MTIIVLKTAFRGEIGRRLRLALESEAPDFRVRVNADLGCDFRDEERYAKALDLDVYFEEYHEWDRTVEYRFDATAPINMVKRLAAEAAAGIARDWTLGRARVNANWMTGSPFAPAGRFVIEEVERRLGTWRLLANFGWHSLEVVPCEQ